MRSCAAEGEKYSRILLPVFLMFAENRELLVLSKRGLLERL